MKIKLSRFETDDKDIYLGIAANEDIFQDSFLVNFLETLGMNKEEIYHETAKFFQQKNDQGGFDLHSFIESNKIKVHFIIGKDKFHLIIIHPDFERAQKVILEFFDYD